MNAQLMIFSGRPDPEFPLPEDTVSALITRLTEVMAGTMSEPPAEGGLGYRGFRLVNDENREGLPQELEVFRGVVTEISEGAQRHFVDSAGVEGLLLEQA